MPTLFLRPKKGQFVMPSTSVALEGETLVIRVQRQLLSPNKLKNAWALYDELFRGLGEAGIMPTGPGIAHYADAPEGGGRITVHAAVVVSAPPREGEPRVYDLPAIEQAATIVHRGSMDSVLPTAQILDRWIEANGYRSVGYPRDVNLEVPENRDDWVTELQVPVVRV